MSTEKACNHKWVSVQSNYYGGGWAMQDECSECGCVGMLADKPDENGIYKIIPKPQATVLDFTEFKKRKEQQNG